MSIEMALDKATDLLADEIAKHAWRLSSLTGCSVDMVADKVLKEMAGQARLRTLRRTWKQERR